jgi:hypothetical protein
VVDSASLSGRLESAVARLPRRLPLAERVCEALRELLGGDGASVTINNLSTSRMTWCTTDKRAAELENLQDVLGEGPCRDAFTSELPVSTATDRWAASRWPQFIPEAERILGPRGVLWSLPMRMTGELIGTVSVYRQAGGALEEPIDDAQILADAAAVLLLTDPATASEIPGQGPWNSRAVVHQAVGKLIALFGTDAGQALAMLRSRAFAVDAQLA